MPLIARTIRIRGRVQGVSFREAMRTMATQFGVVGWVRNRADGSLEDFVQGEPVAVEDLLQWTRLGPPNARVDDFTTDVATPDPSLTRFERRETA